MSGIARLRLNGFDSTGAAARSAEIGSGSTPRNGAGLIETVALARPRPARICASNPPKECPITTAGLSRIVITSAKWSATWPTVLPANTSGCALASSTVSGSSGHPGRTGAYPASSKSCAHRSQLLGSSHRPWTNTAGVRPDALAFSTCWVSESDIVAGPYGAGIL